MECYADVFIEYLISMCRVWLGPVLLSDAGFWLVASHWLTWHCVSGEVSITASLSLNITLSALSLSGLPSRPLARPIQPISNIQKIEQSFHIVKGLNGYESLHSIIKTQYTTFRLHTWGQSSPSHGQWQSDLNSKRGSGVFIRNVAAGNGERGFKHLYMGSIMMK